VASVGVKIHAREVWRLTHGPPTASVTAQSEEELRDEWVKDF
jgi:hypothetical protein